MTCSNARKYTIALLELVDEGVIDAKQALENALGWMEESDVKRMCEVNDYMELIDPNYYEPDEDDYDDSMDGDHESGLASAGWGVDEDYGHYSEDF